MRPETIKKLGVVCEAVGGQPKSEAACELMVQALEPYGDEAISKALDRCVKECKGSLAVKDVVERVDDGRPGADEAWGMVPKSETESIVWTDEMCEAYGIAMGLIESSDMIAARRTFIDAYEKRVQTARNELRPVKWSPSLGTEPSGRERAIRAAVDAGRITGERAQRLLPGVEIGCPALPSGKPESVGEIIDNILKLPAAAGEDG